jgi:hypothetical protein
VADVLHCYRCGESLETLTLPLSRRDECPRCRVELHVCRMCFYYDPRAPEGCAEDDAEEVTNKTRANFCDYFRPDPAARAPGEFEADLAARAQFDSLFGGGDDASASNEDPNLSAAEDLFK